MKTIKNQSRNSNSYPMQADYNGRSDSHAHLHIDSRVSDNINNINNNNNNNNNNNSYAKQREKAGDDEDVDRAARDDGSINQWPLIIHAGFTLFSYIST